MNTKLDNQKQKQEMKQLNYWDAAKVFASYSMLYCAKFPECYRFSITGNITNTARNITVLATQANKIYISNTMEKTNLINAYEGRIEYLERILREIEKFDVDFDLLMMVIDIENDTVGKFRRILSQIVLELDNTDLKDIEIKTSYCVDGYQYYTVKNNENGEIGTKIVRLKFSNSNKSNWLKLRNELEDRVKNRISKDRGLIRAIKKNTALYTTGSGIKMNSCK